MATLWDAADRTAIMARMEKLDASLSPQWGQMSVAQMMAHLIESLKIAFNEKAVQVIPNLNIPPERRHEAIFSPEPWPQGTVKATPEYLPAEYDATRIDDYRHSLIAYLTRFAQAPDTHDWGRNAVFGELTPEEWGALNYKHLDHHLRQFGC